MTPAIGRIVHYQAHGSPDGTHKSVPRAAIVTEVFSDKCVSLAVLNPTGMYFNQSVMLDEGEEPRGGTWRWPARVAALLAFVLAGVLLLPSTALASHLHGTELGLYLGQASPAPNLGSQALDLVLSPTGIAMIIGVLGTVLGLIFGTRTVAKRRFAKAVYHAYHVVEDLAEETETPIDDKTVPFLKAIDDYCRANGWRALKPGEQELAKLEAKALHGAYAAASKAQADALVAAAEAKAGPPTP